MPTPIEFVQQWGPYQTGQAVEYDHEGGAEVLIHRGIARLPVSVPAVHPTTATTTALTPPPAASNKPKQPKQPKKPKSKKTGSG